MRAFRTLVLLTLCAWMATNWFHREPVRRTIFPVHSNALSLPSDHLPEKSRAALASCLSRVFSPKTMDALAAYARERTPAPSKETEVRRLIRFRNVEGRRLYLTWRPEPPSNALALRLFSIEIENSPKELPLTASQRNVPAQDAIEQILAGAEVDSDIRVVRAQGKERHAYTIVTENDRPRSVQYEEAGLRLQCSSEHGPASCMCETSSPE